MKRRSKIITAAIAAPVLIVGGAVAATAAGGTGCATLTYPLCARSVAATQVVDNSLPKSKIVPADRDAFLKDTDTDAFGKQGGTLAIAETAIDKIGGPFATNATKAGEFTLPAGTWLVTAAVQFDRTDANDPDYQAPTTDTMPSFVLRYPGDAGTIMGAAISKAGYTELNGSSAMAITLDAATKITAYAFGYNEDRSGFGSTGQPAGAKSQFSVAGKVTAVRIG